MEAITLESSLKKVSASTFFPSISVKIVASTADRTEQFNLEEDDDEVTHEVFFGENIRRVWKALTKKS